MDYINTSHPNFLGGAKAVEVASQHVKSARSSVSITKPKVPVNYNLIIVLVYMRLVSSPTMYLGAFWVSGWWGFRQSTCI